MVVAHSQGAAVAHHALRESPPSNIRLLLTFGSGLSKLEELLRTKVPDGPVEVSARLVPLLFLLAALLGYIAALAAESVYLAAWLRSPSIERGVEAMLGVLMAGSLVPYLLTLVLSHATVWLMGRSLRSRSQS